MELAPNPRYSGVAEALWGSFKLVTPAPKPVREMTQLPRETGNTKGWGHTNKLRQYKHKTCKGDDSKIQT